MVLEILKCCSFIDEFQILRDNGLPNDFIQQLNSKKTEYLQNIMKMMLELCVFVQNIWTFKIIRRSLLTLMSYDKARVDSNFICKLIRNV